MNSLVKVFATSVGMVVGLLPGMSGCSAAPEDEALGSTSAALSCGKLDANEGLGRGAAVGSCNGAARLVHQSDGNVVLYGSGNRALWATNTAGRATSTFVLQGDGNAVLYNDATALWASNTASNTGAEFRIQDDCNLVIYQGNRSIWSSSTTCGGQSRPSDKVCYWSNTDVGCTVSGGPSGICKCGSWGRGSGRSITGQSCSVYYSCQ